jgi:hypothetical protein
MLEEIVVVGAVGIAACFVVARVFFRKNAGCGCESGSDCARSVDGDTPCACKSPGNSAT